MGLGRDDEDVLTLIMIAAFNAMSVPNIPELFKWVNCSICELYPNELL
jgi:hypothetical protein